MKNNLLTDKGRITFNYILSLIKQQYFIIKTNAYSCIYQSIA